MTQRAGEAISAAKRSYLLIFLLSLSYSFFTATAENADIKRERLANLEPILAVRSLILDRFPNGRPAKMSDLPGFSVTAQGEFEKLEERVEKAIGATLEDDADASDEEELAKAFDARDEKFSEQVVLGAQVFPRLPMPLSSRKVCDVLTWKGSSEEEVTFLTSAYYAGVYTVPFSAVRLIVFEIGCEQLRSTRFNIFVFNKDDDWILGIPSGMFSKIFGSDLAFIEEYSEIENSDLQRFAHEVNSQYVDLNSKYVAIDLRAAELDILNTLGSFDGRTYSLEEIRSAVVKAYDEYRVEADFYGLQVSYVIFLRFAPLALFVITYYFWRQIRKIGGDQSSIEKTWTPLDCNDWIGFIVGCLWAVGTLILTINVYTLYPTAFNTVLILFGREISLEGISKLQFPPALGPGWYTSDEFALVTMIFFAANFVLVVATTRETVRIVTENSSVASKMRSTAKSVYGRISHFLRRAS